MTLSKPIRVPGLNFWPPLPTTAVVRRAYRRGSASRTLMLGRRVIVETDDPRWIAAEKNTIRASHAMDDRACDLVNLAPTTIAGVAALMAYVAAEKTGDGDLAWPDRLVDDEESERLLEKRWSVFLHRSLADSLQSLVDGVQA